MRASRSSARPESTRTSPSSTSPCRSSTSNAGLPPARHDELQEFGRWLRVHDVGGQLRDRRVIQRSECERLRVSSVQAGHEIDEARRGGARTEHDHPNDRQMAEPVREYPKC